MIKKPKDLLVWIPKRNDVPYCVLCDLYYIDSNGNKIDTADNYVYTDYIPQHEISGYYKVGKIVGIYLELMHDEIINYEEKLSRICDNETELIEMLTEEKEEIKYIYDTLIALIIDCNNFENKSSYELSLLHKRYQKAKHLAYMFSMIVENSLDSGFIYDYMKCDDEMCLVGREESEIIEEIVDERIKYHCDAYEFFYCSDYEALFIKDLYLTLFSSNDKISFKSCTACGHIFIHKYGNEKYCTHCNEKEKQKTRANRKKRNNPYHKIYNLLYNKAEYASNQENQAFYNGILNDFIDEHSKKKADFIKEYGKNEGVRREDERLNEKYKEILKIVNRRKQNAKNDETYKRDRLDHESEGEKT